MKYFVFLFSIFLTSTASFAFDPDHMRKLTRLERSKSVTHIQTPESKRVRNRSISSAMFLIPDQPPEEKVTYTKSANFPLLTEVVDLEKPWGFNLNNVVQRQSMVRQNQIVYGSIDQEPTVDVVNLGTTVQRYPALAKMPWEKQKEVIALATELKSLQGVSIGFTSKLKEVKEEKTLFALRQQADETQNKIKKIKAALRMVLKDIILSSLDLELAVSHLQCFVRVKEKILKRFGEYGITIDHLESLPPRDAWDKLRPSAEMQRISRGNFPPETVIKYFQDNYSLDTNTSLNDKSEVNEE